MFRWGKGLCSASSPQAMRPAPEGQAGMGDWIVIVTPGRAGLVRYAGGTARALAGGSRPGQGAGE
jgi:hypothetical protein